MPVPVLTIENGSEVYLAVVIAGAGALVWTVPVHRHVSQPFPVPGCQVIPIATVGICTAVMILAAKDIQPITDKDRPELIYTPVAVVESVRHIGQWARVNCRR